MKLYSAGPSITFNESLEVSIEVPETQPIYNFEQHQWSNEITLEEARKKLEITMYPFKEVSLSLSIV